MSSISSRRARGAWDYDHAMIPANRIRFHVRGEEIVVPLLVESGSPSLLVNRGWYPEGDRVLADLRAGRDAEMVGLVRYDGARTARQTPAGTWSTLSTASMTAALAYPVLPWHVIEGEVIEPDTPPPADLPRRATSPTRATSRTCSMRLPGSASLPRSSPSRPSTSSSPLAANANAPPA